ncbi:multidrug effflux MFS transporter [Tropicibacter oceani]|uniref:Bcr/CflA family efflux transporter n=1 Tax=Tropicibacter oceani TaxID=3058420 RepID=A0ABY8QC97_9RHOB|nr:multidrug effflux MFS transporter [Tropicibacter oceani]WGW02242.1 multidrug effflux MFS transporter [Tropicibacter oceani]
MQSPKNAQFLDRATPPHIVTLILMSGMSALVMNIFIPSLPAMTRAFDTEYAIMQLAVAGYLAMNAVMQLFIGPISDKLGRRPVILGGTAIFCLATIGCIFAQNVTVFLAFRMLQSMIVVAMVLSRAVVRDMYPPDEAASRIGYVTMGMAIVPMISPAIGGALAEVFGWQANFWLMLFLGLGMFWLVWRDLGETATKSTLSLARQFGEYPELFRSPRFWGYALACAFSSGAFFAYVGGAAFVGTQVFGLTPTQLGFYFGAPAIGYAVGNFVSGRYSVRIGINRMVLSGGLIVTGGMFALLLVFWAGLGSALSFFGFMTLVGLGNGMTIPNATSGMMSVRPHLAGTASGLGGAIMIGGGAALSALAGTLLQPGSGAWPLLWMMFLSGAASVVATLLVIARAQRMQGLDAD